MKSRICTRDSSRRQRFLLRGSVLTRLWRGKGKIAILSITAALALIYWPREVGARYLADGIYDSKHNLSATGPGPIKAVSETRVCIFCHTPHDGKPEAPLWNRELPDGSNYKVYESSTLMSDTTGQPTGPSRLCLSCHDGSIALGAVTSSAKEIAMTNRGAAVSTLPPGHTANLETDLSDDHPVSFNYSKALYGAAKGQLEEPGSLGKKVKLFKGRVECSTCHEAHDNNFGKFLTMSNANGALCIKCHRMDHWVEKPGILEESIHKTSKKSWNGFDKNPWSRSSYLAEESETKGKLTVELNACANCHASHTAGGSERLMMYYEEEDNCLQCHNGNVADKDIESEFQKTYIHPIYDTAGEHDPADDIKDMSRRHVECVDCHDRHAVQSGRHDKGRDGNKSSPSLRGVWGVKPNFSPPGRPAAGRQSFSNPSYAMIESVDKEYEICLKCHSSYSFGNSPPSGRRDQGKQFNEHNYSYHPVVEPGENEFCNSNTMEPPWNQSHNEHNTMYCSDCHGSDDPDAPEGPHGSDNPYILRAAGPGDSFDDLCITCHKAEVYLDGGSGSAFEAHDLREHQYDRDTNPMGCMACHAGRVDDDEDEIGSIHGANYQWPDYQGNPGLTSDNLLVGGYITQLYSENGQNTCMANSSAVGDGSHCHMGPQTWP